MSSLMTGKPTNWRDPRTTWGESDGVSSADLRRIEGNSYAVEIAERPPFSSLRELLASVAVRCSSVTGLTTWDNSPVISLVDAENHTSVSQNVHGVGSGYYVARTSDSSQFVHWDDIIDKPERFQ